MGCLSQLIALLLSLSLIVPILSRSFEPAPDVASCPEIVQIALASTDQACEGLSPNEACYGHVLVDATLRSTGIYTFAHVGDRTEVLALESLRLSSMDLQTNMWGVALLNLQAYMQYAEPEDVIFLLFGDVEIDNQVAPVVAIDATVAVNTFVNVRVGPSMRGGTVGVLAPGQTVSAIGRLADDSWVRVRLPENGRVGWVVADLITSTEPLSQLTVVDAWTPYYGPMQAFQLRTGVGDSLCPEAPESGLLIQTPEGVAEVTLLVNEVNVRLSNATAFVQAQPGGDMTFSVLSGWAAVSTGGGQQPVFAGTQVRIPLGDDGNANGMPGLPQPYSPTTIGVLPVGSLGNDITVSQPLSPSDIADFLNSGSATTVPAYTPTSDSASSTGSDTGDDTPAPADATPTPVGSTGTSDPGTTGTSDPTATPPDGPPPPVQSVIPPLGGTPPGLGGTPPGQG